MDPFTLLFKMLEPNSERERWTELQRAWLAFANARDIVCDDGERPGTWPLTRRRLGVIEGVAIEIGIKGSAETYVETEDPFPLPHLTCNVGPASLLSRYTGES